MPAEFLATVDIREMDLDDGDGHGGHGVPQCERVVRQGAGIDDDSVKALARGLLDPVDELAFMIRLSALRHGAAAVGVAAYLAVELRERRASVDGRFPSSQKVQIGTVEHEDPRGLRPCHAAESIH